MPTTNGTVQSAIGSTVAGHLMRSAGVPTSVVDGAFELGGTGSMQARANRAAWTGTLAFLGAR